MLDKIVTIKNVGKFRSYCARGDLQFRRNTLIYAENGRGKTTLCDIFRSLQSGDATFISGRATLGSGDVPVIEVAVDLARPSGPRYGTLVHAVLATVPLDAAPPHVTEVAVLQGRILGATEAEVSSAAAVVSAALGHSLMDRAREAAANGACRRETPVTFREPDASLVEGVVDLAFQEGGAWTVVDFKTDRELEKGLDVYRRQVRLYADIVASATGQPASAVLMRV